MKMGITVRRGMLAAVLAASVALGGCAAGQQSAVNEEQQANRTYMSQVNEAMMQLDDDLDSFVDAVSRGDVVNMRTQADNAYKSLDKIKSLEAPEALSDIHKNYVEGTDKLREALDQYIDLYAKASSAGSSFDWSKYDDQIKSIQKLYDEGVKALEEGDKTAAETK